NVPLRVQIAVELAAGGNAVDDLHAADLDQPVAGGGIKAGRLRVQHDLAQHPRPQALDAHTRMPLARSWATLWTRSLGLHALAKRPLAIFLAIFLGAMLLVDACGLLFSALMLVGAHASWGSCLLGPMLFGPLLLWPMLGRSERAVQAQLLAYAVPPRPFSDSTILSTCASLSA